MFLSCTEHSTAGHSRMMFLSTQILFVVKVTSHLWLKTKRYQCKVHLTWFNCTKQNATG